MKRALIWIAVGIILVATFSLRFPTIDETSATIVDGQTVSLNLVDSASGKSMPMAELSVFPGLALIGSPGTGAAGAGVYELKSPSLALIIGRAPGYRATLSIGILRPGNRYQIPATEL